MSMPEKSITRLPRVSTDVFHRRGLGYRLGRRSNSARTLKIFKHFKANLKPFKARLTIWKALKPICPFSRLFQALNLFFQMRGFLRLLRPCRDPDLNGLTFTTGSDKMWVLRRHTDLTILSLWQQHEVF